ncbi:discoidin domain-containing protein [Paenibacillus alba]|uniref:glycosyl hydrolase family 95 catalytic domain-containing protein n=1 Tax=Paenibacillus alba TaxID=1197127 RepID=UPI0015671767|nr:discoidin domain-containing protein [Paenibacillus alba]NQX67245.1 discoidin domain-containing protein [Paenibacillus alba]
MHLFKRKSMSKRIMASLLSAGLLLPTSMPAPLAEAAGPAITSSAAPDHKLSLWYRQPATDWESEALPIGNGFMGGMVFGGIEQERIQLNEKTLWSGGPGSSFVYNWPSTDDPGSASTPYTYGNREDASVSHLESVRAKLRAGDTNGAHSEANSYLTGLNAGLGSYQTFGDLYLDFSGTSAANAVNYRRELDLEEAASRVKYTLDGVEYTREYFISYPDKVMVTRLTANQSGKLSLDVRPTSSQGGDVIASGNNIQIRGHVADNNMLYEGNFRVLNQGGTLTPGSGKISVANADSLTILSTLGTNYANSYPAYRGEDPHQAEMEILDAAQSKSYDTLLTNHKQDYKSLFDRVKLDLGEAKPTVPTDELLATYAGTKSKALEVLFYQYGRYLLISSSRAGTLPANLQGVWNQSNKAPWSSDYHFNINIQMNYWPAMVSNLSETMTPLIDYVESLREPGRVSSEKYFGIPDAWSVGVANNPFGYTSPGWDFDWGWSPASNAFIANNVWESYKFSGDVDLLRDRVYPILKETAEFWTKFLVEDSDGTLVSTPCYSPEHGTISSGCAYDQQLVFDLFTNYLEASTTLGIDSSFRAEIQDKLNHLSPIQIGKYGQIQEWKQDIDDPNDQHRHISQLVGLFPGKQINKSTPALLDAAKVTLEHRGDGATGWSKANKLNLWARAQDGTHAHTILEGQLAESTLKNLFDTHPPFQIDGNFGATSGMSEMLLQSHLDNIDILPALPSAWPKGSYTGLVARGGFEVGVNWNDTRATGISVKSGKGNRAVVSYPSIAGAIVTNQAGENVSYTTDNSHQISFDTQAGYVYTISSIPLVEPNPLDQKTFNLTVQHSQLRMDVNGVSNADGASIIQWSAGTGLNQQWAFKQTEPGYYKIISKSSSKVLAVENASTEDGAGIIQSAYTNDAVYNDEWSVVDAGDGYYQLKNRGSGKVIEIPGNSSTGGVQFVQRTAGTGNNQKFQLSLDRAVNDNATWAGSDQFVYNSGWGYASSESGAYNRDNHYSNMADTYVLLRFTGTKVQLYGAKNNNQGIAAISIDDGPEALVDTYAPSRSDQQLLFESKSLMNQEHVLRIRVTGQKNASANNTFVSIDRADIQSRVEKSAAGNYFNQRTETINGVNHTVIALSYAGDDAGDAVRAAIEAAKAAPKPVILDFPAGTYHFKASTANNAQYYISNTSTSGQTPGGWRKVGLLFKDISDLTIRGNGSTLLFHGVMTPIVFDHATNVKVNGINIDFNRPVVSEMTVTEVGSNYMKASIHPDSWYNIQNNQLTWIGEENWTQNGTQNVSAAQEYDPVTKKTWRVGNPLGSVTNAQDLGDRVVQFNYASSPNVAVGHTYQLRDTTRREQGTLIYRSKEITWTDVNFYAAPGLGIISQSSENLTLDRLNFAPKAGSGRTNASMADFLQVSGSKGELQVTNSHFAGAQDDAINVHGTHLQIVQIPASNQVKVQFMHPESWGFDAFAVGDTIAYMNKSTLLAKESAVVTGVTRVDDTQIILTLDKTVPVSVAANEYVVENTTWTPNVTITNSTFETIPTRGILVTTRGAVRIENNMFGGMPMSAILIADDAQSWYESGMVKDVLIRNNTFTNVGNAVISVEPSTSLKNPNQTVHSHIVVDGNRFNPSSGNSAIYAKSVDGFTFTNNTATQGGLELAFDASKAVTVAGNSFTQSNSDKKINFNRMIAGTDSVEANQGFVVTRTNNYELADPNEIPQSQMTATATSNHSGNQASNAIDEDPSTFWHSEWDPMANLPQSIILDFGNTYVTSKLRYVPRQDGEVNGNITAYGLSISADGSSFTPIANGTWKDDSSEKNAVYAPAAGRYLKLTATAGHGGYASASEIHVIKAASVVQNQELVALIANAQGKHDSAVEGSEIGQYPAGSKQTLQTAIDAANRAVGALTQQEIDQAKDDLNQALRAFEASVISSEEPYVPDSTNRQELNFNTGWLFNRGDVSGAEAASFDDSGWEGVNLPHSVRLEPKITGGNNQSYQGIAWYRRHVPLDSSYAGKKLFVEFEGAMTNAEVWVNGTYLGIHHGGYTPFTLDITNYVHLDGTSNVISVKLDNRDDPQTPPGKPQRDLDFEYFGGIYRDVKLHVTDNLHVTDAVFANKVADGGIFVTYPSVSASQATVQVKTNIINEYAAAKNTSVKTTIVDSNNQVVATMVSGAQSMSPGSDYTFVQSTTITNPKLWHPDHPNLYTVYTAVSDGNAFVDSYKTRIGIRRIEFTPDQGFLINGEKLMLNGANRHQEYLYVGNALPNSGQYRDAKQIREGGFNNVRTGHYPQDPAFLDAADELGLTVIEPTPGWQFFGDSVFEQRSYQAIRDMVRRDRNHPSIIMWESSLNETTYSLEYAQNAHNATHEEYPGDQTYTSAEYGFYGKEVYDVNYKELKTALKPLFTREWGDDWSESATSPTGYRSVRKVGEIDMLNSIILRQKALNGDGYFDWAGLNANPRIAGHAVWSFSDNNRGMDADPAYSGLVDLDRYPKFNYYFFQSQRDPNVRLSGIDSGPMVFIANQWTSSSPRDVTVASNAEQVKLYLNDKLIATQNPDSGLTHVKHPTFTFSGVPWEVGTLRADGLIGGAVVASHSVTTPGQPHHLSVEYDTKGKGLVADGSDLVMAYITVRDANNNIVPSNALSVSLSLSGPGGLIGNGDTRILANPVVMEAGVAAALVKSSLTPGTLKLTATASGLLAGSAEITSTASHSVFVSGGSDGGDNWFAGENVALNKSATSSSESSGNLGPNGNDGNETTRWEAANGNPGQWWEVDLGSSFNITGSEIVWASGNTYYQYKIDVSEDQVNWTTILDKTQNTTAAARQRDKLVANARYVRVTVTGAQNGPASFYEMKVFGVAPFQNQAEQHPALVNVALNKSVTASSSASGNEPSKANDGVNGSWWEASGSAPGWLQVDLGASYNLTGSKILWGRDNMYYTYKVEVSANGLTWSQVAGRSASGQDMNPDNFTAASIRYVRVSVDSLSGGSGTEKPAIKEIQVYSEPVNIALTKPASADSYQSNHPVAAGNDGNESSRWSAADGNAGHWYQVDLGASYDISGTRVKWEMDNQNYGYRIEVSDDNANWTTASEKSSSQQVQFDYFNTHARYVRIQVTDLSGAWASFWEFDVYGAVPIDTSLIPQSQMTATATSEETSGDNNDASQAIDGNPSTIWHTKWDMSNSLPQSITIDLGQAHVLSKLKYLPRQNGAQNGNITSYELSTSIDGISFTPFARGNWSDDNSEKIAAFAPATSRYLKLTATAGHGGYASAAEINVVRSELDEDYQTLAALITSAQSKHDSAVEGNADGQYPVGSKQALQEAIDLAKQAGNNASVTQQLLQQATNDLNAALQSFVPSGNVSIQSIIVTGASDTIVWKGGTLQLSATVLPANATNQTVTWAVYEVNGAVTDKAIINPTGLLTAVKDGTVKVVATATDGSAVFGVKAISISGQNDSPGTGPVHVAAITVISASSSINVKGGSLPLGVMVLPTNATNQTVTWAVYEVDGAVTDKAIVNPTGLLTAVKDGTVKVVATATDGSAVFGVKVISISGQNDSPGTGPVNVASITVTSTSSSINVKGGSLPFEVLVLPTNATNQTVTWAVYEMDGTVTDKAIINSSGLLTAAKNGTVKVVATANDGSLVFGNKVIMISGQNDNSGPDSGSGGSSGSSGSGSPTTPPVKEDPTRYVPKDTELRVEPAQDNQTAITASIDRERLAQKLADLKAAGSSILNFEMPGKYEKNAVQLPLDILYSSMKDNKGTVLTLRSHLGSYNLPLSILNREDVASAVNMEGAVLIIRMDKAKSQQEKQFEQSIANQGMKRLSDMIDYKVILKSKDQEVEITNFGNSFITRVMKVEGAIQDSSIATAVVYDQATGELKFVPSVFTVNNGKTEVTITRNTNSLYAIVQNKKTFDDMVGHWAQKDVENLASKMVIDGTTDRTYTPEMQVTRAQFAALLVRGLGLPTETTPSVFTDVAATQWYASEVGTATKYGLVQGVGEGRFNPDELITREQMVVMMMKAVHLVQGESKPGAVANTRFADQDQLSDYARSAVAEATSKGLVHGKTETTFAPQDAATRAEAAVLIKQAMQYLKLIN